MIMKSVAFLVVILCSSECDIAEEHIPSAFRVKDLAKQENSRSRLQDELLL
jgi:hypothetical protein